MLSASWELSIAVLLGSVLLLFVAQVPIFLAFFIVNLGFTFIFFGTRGFGFFTNSIFAFTTTSALVTAPLFILMGEILFKSGAMDAVYRSMDVLVPRIRARLYVLSMVLSVIYGALSGSGIAVAAMMGRSIYPGMAARGCDPKLSAGTLMAGASLAPIIPPSVVAILVGTLANISIADLLVSGILPGLLIAALCVVYIAIRLRFDPKLDSAAETELEQEHGHGRKKRVRALLTMLPFVGVIFAVVGTIMLGIATPEESAAMGVLASVLVAAYYRSLSIDLMIRALTDSARVTGVILLIMASSLLFSQILAYTGATNQLANLITTMSADRWLIFFVMQLIPFILCMFIDQTAVMLIMIPIFSPIINILGFDPLWFWLLFLINMTLGGITPPFGYVLFTFSSASNLRMPEIYRAAIPFVVIFLVAMFLIALFPEIATFLPSLSNS